MLDSLIVGDQMDRLAHKRQGCLSIVSQHQHIDFSFYQIRTVHPRRDTNELESSKASNLYRHQPPSTTSSVVALAFDFTLSFMQLNSSLVPPINYTSNSNPFRGAHCRNIVFDDAVDITFSTPIPDRVSHIPLTRTIPNNVHLTGGGAQPGANQQEMKW